MINKADRARLQHADEKQARGRFLMMIRNRKGLNFWHYRGLRSLKRIELFAGWGDTVAEIRKKAKRERYLRMMRKTYGLNVFKKRETKRKLYHVRTK